MITKLSSVGQKLVRLGTVLLPHTRNLGAVKPLLRPYQHRPLTVALPRVSTPLATFLGSNVLPKIIPKVAVASIKLTSHIARVPLTFVGFGVGAVGYAHIQMNELSNNLSPNWALLAASQIRSYYDSTLQKGLSDITMVDLFSKFFPSQENSKQDEKENGNGNSSKPPNMIPAALFASAAANEQKEKVRIIPPEPVEEPRRPKDDQFMILTKKLIEIRNMLKTIDHDETLQLPSIVVIGSQSSGKSSVLEAIVGREFLPKGSNMVTRRPIELTLINTPDSHEEYAEFPQVGLEKVRDFQQVQKTLMDMNMSVSDAECVSSKPIELRIYSPNIPDLTLIDLPGYIQIHNVNQPPALKQKIQDLCESYIRRQNIILAVCSADVDLANSEALLASRKVDPLGVRTIGVITKMDLVPPENGVAILQNTDYPLHLGYIGVICKNLGGESGPNGNKKVVETEDHYFRSNHVYSQRNIVVGTGNLRDKLTNVLEENMKRNLSTIVDRVQTELEEARYQFKVEYNDRRVTAESYVAETMDTLKLKFKDFAGNFGKPQVRQELRNLLEERVLDISAEMYWADPKIFSLGKDNSDDVYWEHKLDICSSLLTKSGLGRSSTQMVVDLVMKNMEKLASNEPFLYHPDTQRQIVQFSHEILKSKYQVTVDQVENTIKPYKYEVECTEQEWADGLKRSIGLLQKEISMCEYALTNIKTTVGKAKLRSAIKHVLDSERDEQRRAANKFIASQEEQELNMDSDLLDAAKPHFNPILIDKAKEAICLKQRAMILKYRLATLKSRKCKNVDNKTICPEVFLNVVAEKLVYTAVMFIQVELLNEFFFLFPREVDNRLYYGLNRNEIDYFAKENPRVMKQLKLAERKLKLEEVMEKLMYLVRRQEEFGARKYLR